MTTEFKIFDLHPELVQAVAERGYKTPTPIQSAVIPIMLTRRDVIGQAQTGTGKTAAFALPILQNLNLDQGSVQSLVLTPTRELAMQVADAIYEFGRYREVQVLAVYGGQSYSRQTRRLKKGVDVVVGTPGRLLDLIRQKVLDLGSVQTVVLDEADEMLSMGFIEDIQVILTEIPSTRQTALFSATLSSGIRQLANNYMQEPKSITIQRKQLTVESIEQRYYLVNEGEKLAAITRLLEVEEVKSALIFTRTRASTSKLAKELALRGFSAEGLSGDLNQDARIRVLSRFRQEQIRLLVATDVAARGLDINDISHVFNYDLPYDPEVYVHRIGRTGRAGKTGIAISLLSPADLGRLRKIEALTKRKLTQANLPKAESIQRHRDKKLAEQLMVWLHRDRCHREKEIVADLVEAGYDPIDIAAVALKLARVEEKQRPIEPIGKVRDRRSKKSRQSTKTIKGHNRRGLGNGSHEKGMVRFTFSRGKMHGVRPKDVVSKLAFHAEIPGHVIGKIHIQNKHTLVDIPERYVDQVLAKSGTIRIRKHTVNLERV
jgi:ATP-dependent RNA helicase DeaD